MMLKVTIMTTYRAEMLKPQFNPGLDRHKILHSLRAAEPPRDFLINGADGKQMWPRPPASPQAPDYRQTDAGRRGGAVLRGGFGELVGEADGVLITAPTSRQVEARWVHWDVG
jgi:hypothetical protein